MTPYDCIRPVMEVDGIFYAAMELISLHVAQFSAEYLIKREGHVEAYCAHCGKDFSIRSVAKAHMYSLFLLCEECVGRGKKCYIVDTFIVEKVFELESGKINPELHTIYYPWQKPKRAPLQ